MSRAQCQSCGKEISGYPCVFCKRRSASDSAKTTGSSPQAIRLLALVALALVVGGYLVVTYATGEGGEELAEMDAWVTVDRLNRRTCPQSSCGSVGVLSLGEGVTILDERNGWARITEPYDASCINGTSEYVDSGNDACEAANGIIDDRFAEWVSMEYLNAERPPDPAAGATGIYALVSNSDDYATYREAFAKAASDLMAAGTCFRADFEEMGGWLKSTFHAAEPIYFTYCGGFTLSHRLYLNASTGQVFR